MAVLGIDIGGQLTKVVGVTSDGRRITVRDSRGEVSMPTALFFSADGSVAIGRDAIKLGRVDPTRLVVDFKGQLGGNKVVYEDMIARDVYRLVLADIKRRAEAQLSEGVSGVVLTRPVSLNEAQTADLVAAAEAAYLDVLGVITEPSAAAFDELHQRQAGVNAGADSRTLCIDLGSTTFDATLLRCRGGEATVLASEGLQDLGGRKLTSSLERLILQIAATLARRSVSLAKLDPGRRRQFEEDVEDAKLALSTMERTQVAVPFAQAERMVEVAKVDFDREVASVLAPGVASLRALLERARVSAAECGLVLWVGGPFRAAAVRSIFEDAVGTRGVVGTDPVLSVAGGAARHAQQLFEKSATSGTLAVPRGDITLREATTRAYGLAVVDFGGGTRRHVFASVLPKGSPIPSTCQLSLRLESINQSMATFRFLQGDSGAPIDACTPIGECVLDGLSPESTRTPRISVELSVDEAGLVHATVSDSVSGQRKSVTLRVASANQKKPRGGDAGDAHEGGVSC